MAWLLGESDFIWRPTEEILNQSNVAKFIKYAGYRDFVELLSKSTQDSGMVLECSLLLHENLLESAIHQSYGCFIGNSVDEMVCRWQA